MPLAIRVIDDITQLGASGFGAGDFAEWNGTQFVPGSAAGDIGDLSAAGFSSGQIPQWNGVSFVPVDHIPAALKFYMAGNYM